AWETSRGFGTPPVMSPEAPRPTCLFPGASFLFFAGPLLERAEVVRLPRLDADLLPHVHQRVPLRQITLPDVDVEVPAGQHALQPEAAVLVRRGLAAHELRPQPGADG